MPPRPGRPTAALMVLATHPVAALLWPAAVGAALVWGAEGVLGGAAALALQLVVQRFTGARGLPGPVLAPGEQPEVTDLVRRVAERSGFAEPIAVGLLPVPDAALFTTRLHGAEVVALVLGLPYLLALTEAQLAAVVAHELNHRRHLDDRRSGAVLRARAALADAVDGGALLPSLLGRPLLRRTQELSFSFELECDARAVEVVGATAVREALRETAVLSGVFFGLAGRWVDQLGEQGQHPADLYDATLAALADPLVRERALDDADVPSPVDSHPTLAARLAALPEHGSGPYGEHRVPLRHREELVAASLEDLLDTSLTPVRVLDDPTRVRSSADDAREAVDDISGAGSLDALLDRVDRDELGPLPDEVRHALVSAGARLLSERLQGRGWEVVSPWLSSHVRGPDGTTQDLRLLVREALEGDTSRVRELAAS